ncbi:MAG: chaperone NapD [Candidatus Latescibacterota bacterium]|nr:MAG: chaperone NapD [Candidatus Latescibacterota bacterium]
MHYAAIYIQTTPDRLDDCVRLVETLPGLEVRHVDAQGGRLIAVQEAAVAEALEACLRRIQNLPTVLTAEPVYHYVERDSDADERPAAARRDAGVVAAPAPTKPAAAPLPPATAHRLRPSRRASGDTLSESAGGQEP